MTDPTFPPSIQSLIPTDATSQAILRHTHTTLPPPIFNHSLRTYLLATRLHNSSSLPPSTYPSGHPSPLQTTPPHLFATCMFHDMGTHPSCNGPSRFEVEGGDAAVSFLRSHGITDHNTLQSTWCAIALHTSVGIAERIDPFTRLVRYAVKADFSVEVRDGLGLGGYAEEIEGVLPRLEIEAVLARAVVEQATRGEVERGLYVEGGEGVWTDSVKFPRASWPGVLLRGHLEKVREEGKEWKGRNPAF